jgi:hypothetical protein
MSELSVMRFIYLGQRIVDGKLKAGLAPEMIEVDEETTSNWDLIKDPTSWFQSLWWQKSKVRTIFQRYAPGDVIQIEAGYDGEHWTIHPNSTRHIGRVGQGEFDWIGGERQEEILLDWASSDRRDRTEMKRRGLKKDRDELRSALAPVRAIYQRQVGANRAAMLAEILREIGV